MNKSVSLIVRELYGSPSDKFTEMIKGSPYYVIIFQYAIFQKLMDRMDLLLMLIVRKENSNRVFFSISFITNVDIEKVPIFLYNLVLLIS